MSHRRRSSPLLFLLTAIASCCYYCAQTPAAIQDAAEGLTKDRGEIRFPRGSTSARVQGRVGRNVRDQYLIRARRGQLMSVSLQSPDPRMGFDVYATTGLEALPVTAADELQTAWAGKLPAGDEYYINVRSTGAGGDYSFEVKIENTSARPRNGKRTLTSAEASPPTSTPTSAPAAVAKEFRAIIGRVKQGAGVALLLPEALPASITARPLYVEGVGEKNGYTLTLASRPRCGANSCSVGFFGAAKGETLAEEFDRVSLAGGIDGAYKPLSCGGSCSPPMIEWEYEGALYTIQLNVDSGDDERDRQTLVNLANSAIKAGPR